MVGILYTLRVPAAEAKKASRVGFCTILMPSSPLLIGLRAQSPIYGVVEDLFEACPEQGVVFLQTLLPKQGALRQCTAVSAYPRKFSVSDCMRRPSRLKLAFRVRKLGPRSEYQAPPPVLPLQQKLA